MRERQPEPGPTGVDRIINTNVALKRVIPMIMVSCAFVSNYWHYTFKLLALYILNNHEFILL